MPPLAPRCHLHARAREREHGFTLVEIMAVLVIIAILGAVAIIGFRGSKTKSYARDTKTVGAAYAQAIAQFQADNANANPAAADMIDVGGDPAGPRNLLNKPYLAAVPDSVSNGRISVDMRSCSASGAGTFGHVSYCPGTAPAYSIAVRTRDTTTGPWTVCYLGSTTQTPRC